jgi:predicted  nucleic acid-binding Zn-ribbon protein
MAPVTTGASPTDVDNEATAELPVLDVAAFEASLNEAEGTSHTDTWVVPGEVAAAAVSNREMGDDATVILPKVKAGTEKIPTLPPAYDLDHSGTHEMPAIPALRKAEKKAEKVEPPAKRVKPAAQVRAPAPPPVHDPTVQMPVLSAQTPPSSPSSSVPPSPPMIDELRKALAAAERRIQELDERARIMDAERSVAVARANGEAAQLREQLGFHLEALQTEKGRRGAQRAHDPSLEDELFARADRIASLEKEVARRSRELEETRARLGAALARGEALDADVMNLRESIRRRNAHVAILEADLQARQERTASLSVRLTEALASQAPHVPQLRSEISTRDDQVRGLAAELAEAQARTAGLEEDLEVAEESIRNLEIEVRDKSHKLEEANVTVEEWRAVIAESQRSLLQRDSRIQELEADLEKRVSAAAASAAASDSAAMTGEEIALEGPARVLIRTDGNTDFVHVLARRTRIGRGPDNEIVLDTKHVSRYHAVLLAGPVHTSIEDLNSTNGVFVNSKRVARQVLKDGDRVTIGRTQYRYTVRS